MNAAAYQRNVYLLKIQAAENEVARRKADLERFDAHAQNLPSDVITITVSGQAGSGCALIAHTIGLTLASVCSAHIENEAYNEITVEEAMQTDPALLASIGVLSRVKIVLEQLSRSNHAPA